MLTFKPEVMRNEQKVDGTFNVKVRITYQRKVKRWPTTDGREIKYDDGMQLFFLK